MSNHAGNGIWQLGHGRSLLLDRPRIMAIINATPDSFYDRSRASHSHQALSLAQRAWREGADMLDIGGESTRPGAQPVDPDEQIARVVPVIEAIRQSTLRACDADGHDQPVSCEALREIPISVDTTDVEVARAAIDAGADAINDVSAGLDAKAHAGTGSEPMFELAAATGSGLILMHRRTTPDQDRYSDEYTEKPAYGDVVGEVRAYLQQRVEAAERVGVDGLRVVLDPGLGFGKSVEDNLLLIDGTDALVSLGYPVLSALSRKSFVGRVSLPHCASTDPGERLAGTLALSVLHHAAGCAIFRVHDVAAHRQALLASQAVDRAKSSQAV